MHQEVILPPPMEPEPLVPGRVLLSHPALGLTVTEDLETGGVWVRQQTGATDDEVYLTRGSWMVMAEWLASGGRSGR